MDLEAAGVYFFAFCISIGLVGDEAGGLVIIVSGK
jgi:hypothetical protein